MFFSRSRITVYLIIFGLVLFVFVSSRLHSDRVIYDPFYLNMHELVFNITDVNIIKYEEGLNLVYNQTVNKFAKADISLVKARLLKDNQAYEDACKLYFQYETTDSEEIAILYETLASLNCFNEKDRWLKKASILWDNLNMSWRSSIINQIIRGENYSANLIFETSLPESKLNLSNASVILIGNSSLTIRPGMKIISQEDRVYRDWLSLQLSGDPFNSTLLKVFSERFTYNEIDLRNDIGWHEGGELIDILSKVKVNYSTAVGSLAVKNHADGKWYAPSEDGVFRFEVLPDKIYYPTTRFLSADVAMIIDTHGISAIAEQALRKHADIVIGCCDSKGKIKAGLYLSKFNISVICLTDRYSYLALGDDSKIIGSARLSDSTDGAGNKIAVMNGAKVKINRGETIVVSNIFPGKEYPVFYYSTPYYYFSQINATFPINLIDVKLSAYNETDNIFSKAIELNATVVGFRVFNLYDYNAAKAWLNSSMNHQLVLFHSMSYPYGKLLANEYSSQISFGDLQPVILK